MPCAGRDPSGLLSLLLVCLLGEAKYEASNNKERGGALALGGRRFININNNQMEDGVDVRGCVGEEARPGWNVWGGRLPFVWGGILIDKKNREMGGSFALDCHRLMGGHNNQPKVSINGGRGIEEERRPGWNVWGGVVSSLGAVNRRRKKTTTKIRCSLRRPPTNENHTTTNQKHAGATKEVKEGCCDRQGERGGSANRSFWGDRFG
jgi:hypothetical protein